MARTGPAGPGRMPGGPRVRNGALKKIAGEGIFSLAEPRPSEYVAAPRRGRHQPPPPAPPRRPQTVWRKHMGP